MPTLTQTWLVATRRDAPQRVTIADVAREAGVNKGTVSRALRGVAGVGPSTRERILEAADRLEFSASHIASVLATGASQTVGIVLPTLRSWYFSEVAAGASAALAPAGYRVELVSLGTDSDFLDVDSAQVRRLFAELGAGRGRDAILFAGTVSEDGEEAQAGTAHMSISVSRSSLTQVAGVFVDNGAGARLVAEHLADLGHTQMAVLDGRMPGGADTRIWEQRTEGFCHAVVERGLPAPDIVMTANCWADNGAAGTTTLLRRDVLPTAVFCHTDEMAYGALATLRRAGLRCPDDISVAGFDGHPMSQWWGLTTVTQHAYQQGVRAAELLISILDGTEPPVRPHLAVELVPGETTGAPRRA